MTRLSRRAWLAAGATSAAAVTLPARAQSAPRALLFVLLRGGADGLSLVVPHANRAYYAARPELAIAPPGAGADSCCVLTGEYGLHPRLAAFAPSFAAGRLAIWTRVAASAARAHADAERDVARTLTALGKPVWRVPGASLSERCEQALHRGDPDNVAVVCSDGWDTHFAQGNASFGRMADNVAELGQALSRLEHELAGSARAMTVVVASELGRTVAENESGGTDDARAGVVFAFGAGVRGGVLHGGPPPLEPSVRSLEGGLRAAHSLDGVLGSLGFGAGPS